jgi:hypothetical protein
MKMYHTPVFTLLMFFTFCSQAATTSFQVTGSVKTVDKTKSDRQDLPRGSIQRIEKEQILSMELRRINPTVGEHATVEWVVVLEGVKGQPMLGTYGSQPIHTQIGIPITLESESFSLKERNFNGDGKTGNASAEQKVKGYGIRVVDQDGNEIGTKFQPSSVEEDARKVFELKSAAPGADQEKENQPKDKRDRKLRKFLKE